MPDDDRDQALTAKFRSLLPLYLLPTSPNLSAAHASRHQHLKGQSTLCPRCGHFLASTRVATRKPQISTSLTQESLAKKDSWVLEVSRTCGKCMGKTMEIIMERRRSDNRAALRSVRKRRKSQKSSLLGGILSINAPVDAVISESRSMAPPSDERPQKAPSVAHEDRKAMTATKSMGTAASTASSTGTLPRIGTKKRHKGLEGMLARSKEQKEKEQSTGSKLSDFLQSLE